MKALLTFVLLVGAMSAQQIGFDFRATQGFVTDAPGNYGIVPSTVYPTLVNGMNVGWVNRQLVQGRDRSTSVDHRLAGINFATNGKPATFYVDLAPGTYSLALAMGDAGWPECTVQCQVQFLDGSTILATVTHGKIPAGYFVDANGTQWTAAQWPSSNVSILVTLTGTRLTMVIGTANNTGDFTTVAFLGIAAQAPAHGLKLSWTLSVTPGVNKQLVCRSTSSGTEDCNNPLATLDGSTTSYLDGGVMVGTAYYYVVEACINNLCSGPSNEVSATFASAPSGLSVCQQ